MGHHSLVTPIDWKLTTNSSEALPDPLSHHSLVTPIDWKRQTGERRRESRFVTTRW